MNCSSQNAVSSVGSLCSNWKEHLLLCATWCFRLHTFSLEIPLVIFFVLVLFVKLPRMYNVSWVVAAVLCGTKQRQPCRLSVTHFLFDVLLNACAVSFSRPDSFVHLWYSCEESTGVPWLCLNYFTQFLLHRYLGAHGVWGEYLHAEVK